MDAWIIVETTSENGTKRSDRLDSICRLWLSQMACNLVFMSPIFRAKTPISLHRFHRL